MSLNAQRISITLKMCHIPSLPIIFLRFYRQSRLPSTTKCLSWQCNLSDGENRYDVSCRNLSVSIFSFMSIIIIINFRAGCTICVEDFFDNFTKRTLKWKKKKRVGIFFNKVDRRKESSTIFLLITCLWIINWRILMFLFSLRSSIVARALLNACYEINVHRSEAKLSVNK